jgi:nickel-dependent lactate racemase
VDVVITSAAGYPLDTTFYQAVKGLTAALPVVKRGGTIILTAECREGLGSPEFTQLVHDVNDMDQFMKDIYRDDYFVVDQWQFEELVKVLRKAKVYLYAEGVKQADEPKVPVIRVMSVEEGIERALRQYGEDASIAVIPRGPYILADIEGE